MLNCDSQLGPRTPYRRDGLKGWRKGLLLAASVLATCALLPAQPLSERSAEAAGSGFWELETVVGGLDEPTALAFAPGGRIFVVEKRGVVRLVKNGELLDQPFLDFQSQVNDWWDRGLLGLAVDPAFEQNGYIYLLYTFENDPTPSAYPKEKTGRLTRVTASGDFAQPGSEVDLLGTEGGGPVSRSCDAFPAGTDCIASDSPSHSVGALRFDPTGALWVSIGDGAFFTFADDRALRSQDVDRLNGKLLRVRSDGSGLSDNPFYSGDPRANRSKVWAYGLRNPFRFTLRPGSNQPYIGDVGSTTWEEVNRGPAGANFGWPCWEGLPQQPEFSPKPGCQARYAEGGVTPPLWDYHHGGAGAAILGGLFYQGGSYPAEHVGGYFILDIMQGWLKRLSVSEGSSLAGVTDLLAGPAGLVDMAQGPDGDLYFVGHYAGELKRLRWLTGNRPPSVQISAAPSGGPAPLLVRFSSESTSDPDGDPLSFSWSFGDGTPASTERNPEHLYQQAGVFKPELTVNDGQGGIRKAALTITVVSAAPSVTVLEPNVSLKYVVGQRINVMLSAVDPEDGPLSGASLHWTAIVHHCTGADCHQHQLIEGTGASGDFVAPDHEDDSYLEIVVTARDSASLVNSKSVTLQPRKIALRLQSKPKGAALRYGGAELETPIELKANVGGRRTVFAASPSEIGGRQFQFERWSDGGAQQHDFVVPAKLLKLKARYVKVEQPR